MKRTKVKSSNIASIGYEIESKILEIEFNKGTLYEYYNVPEEEYKNIMNANSYGKYYIAKIKDNYSYNRIK